MITKVLLHNSLNRGLLTCIIFLFITQLNAQQNFYKFLELEMWEEQKFAPTLTRIRSEIDENYTAANVPKQLIYYKGICYCCNGNQSSGINNFDWILHNYNLAPESLFFIKNQKTQCANPSLISGFDRLYTSNGRSLSNNSTEVVFVSVSRPSVSGKGGSSRHKRMIEEVQVEGQSVIIGEQPVSMEKFKARLYDVDSADSEMAILARFEVDDFRQPTNVLFSKHFAIINYTDAQVRSSYTAKLEQSLRFLSDYYSLKIPKHRMTVFLVNGGSDMQRLASKAHNVNLSGHLIGYSVNDDLSIMAVTPNRYDGTVKHELTHLLLYHQYIALSPWLAEGIPGIYSETRFRFNRLLPYLGWRVKFMDRSSATLIKDLVGYNWLEYNSYSSPTSFNFNRLSINHSMSRFFCIYLDYKGKLREVLRRYVNRTPETVDQPIAEDNIEILEDVMGQSIEEIELDFWDFYRDFERYGDRVFRR